MEIISKESPKKNKNLKKLLYFILILLFISVAIFFISNHFHEKRQKELASLKQFLVQKEENIKFLEKKILPYQKKIDNFSFFINQQLKSLKFFTIFEKITHPQVWLTEINLDLKNKKITLAGQAKNFEVLGQQIYIIQNEIEEENGLESFSLEVVSIADNKKINFYLIFNITP